MAYGHYENTRKSLPARQKVEPAVTGVCEHCDINLWGSPPRPGKFCLPCGVAGCPHEPAGTKPLTNDAGGAGDLWSAVILCHLWDALDLGVSKSKFRARREARAWFEGNSAGFRMVCSLAGMDPDKVRARVINSIADGRDIPRSYSHGERRQKLKTVRARADA